jgi:hypothetical protein
MNWSRLTWFDLFEFWRSMEIEPSQRKGVAVPCYTSNLLEAQRNSQDGTVSFEDEEDIKGSAGTLLTGDAFPFRTL